MVRSVAALVLRQLLALLVRRDEDAKNLEIVVLRHQLAVYKRTANRPKLRRTDRLFWVWWPGSGPGGDSLS